jgi:hypothetical protein
MIILGIIWNVFLFVSFIYCLTFLWNLLENFLVFKEPIKKVFHKTFSLR